MTGVRRGLAALAALALLTACGGSGGRSAKATASPTPSLVSGVRFFPGLSHAHTQQHVAYPETPPVGGPHNPAWLRCGVYTTPVPNENAVHSMEHGAVWVTYRPGLAEHDVKTLTALARFNPSYFLLSPYAGLPAPVVASAWGLQLEVQSAEDARLAQFVQAYIGKDQGGEMGADCAHGATLQQALESFQPGPTVTATPTSG